MKALKDTLNEVQGKHKSGPLKKLYILTLMLPYAFWNEDNIYDDFFGKLSQEEIDDFEALDKELTWLDESNQRRQFSVLSYWYEIINKLCDYMLTVETSRWEKLVWKEIKSYVE